MSATIRVLIVFLLSLTAIYAEGDTTQKVDCQLTTQDVFMPATDGYGKTVYLKQEFVYQCDVTTTERVGCKEWEVTKKESDGVDYNYTDQYETLDYSDSFGGAMMMVQNLNRLDKLFTGWKGTCYKGVEADFSWAEDPYMWASMAVSAMGQGMDQGLYSERFVDGSSNFWGNAAMTMGITDPKKVACLANSGIDLAKTADTYFNGGDMPCDPKDEICESDQLDEKKESDIYTLNATEFEEFKKQMEEMLGESGAGEKYIKILDIQGSGSGAIYSFTYSPPSTNTDIDNKDMEKKMEELKRIQAAIGVAVGTSKAAACLGGMGGYGGGSWKGDNPVGSTAGIASQVIGAVVPPLPYGIALQLMTNVITSFESINSCDKSSDAANKGSLHEKTQKSLKWGMCHKTAERCEFQFPLSTSCDGKRYFYCCYDQAFTKMLMVQVKAQLGKSWESCADLSLNELKALNFRQCSQEEMDSGYIDGAGYLANNRQSFQMKYACMDLTEFREYMQAYVGEIDDRVFFDSLEDFRSGLQN